MGRIKTALIKRITYQLLESYGDKFKDDFEKNKKLLINYINVHSKKMRNIIAGYITRLKRGERI